MLRFRSFVLSFIFLSGCASINASETALNPDGWQIIFENDASGNTVSGSKSHLIEAVRDGKQVRVYTAGRRIEHVTDAAFLSIFEGEALSR